MLPWRTTRCECSSSAPIPTTPTSRPGGSAAKWCALGHVVRLVSLTNGQAGHQSMRGPELARRRRAEAQASAASIGASYEVLDHPDGELDDRLEYRHRVIRLIRGFRPDLILTHRSTDYHPDHRFAGLLVQDAAYLLTVPAICPDAPHLAAQPGDPLLLGRLQEALPVRAPRRRGHRRRVRPARGHAPLPPVAVLRMAPLQRRLPRPGAREDEAARRSWLAERMGRRIRPLADRYRDLVVRTYGQERGAKVQFIEAFEVSEFGAPLDAAARARLFPFLPASSRASSPFARKEWVDLPEEE